MDWITALRSEAIDKLVKDQTIQMGLFDERNLFELTHPDFPNERLVACRNNELAKRRDQKASTPAGGDLQGSGEGSSYGRTGSFGRQGCYPRPGAQGPQKVQDRQGTTRSTSVTTAFEFEFDEVAMAAEAARLAKGKPELENQHLKQWKQHRDKIDHQLERVRQRVGRGQLHGKDKIGVRVGKVVNKHKVGKHIKLDIGDNSFEFEIKEKKVAAEAALDGIYVIRTSLSKQRMSAEKYSPQL